ncbi:hypothetical protein TNCV_505311 [Trichonephila clavipes]|nr:hypothetical protein TNCV_505311 [Trichonephila clavipes]
MWKYKAEPSLWEALPQYKTTCRSSENIGTHFFVPAVEKNVQHTVVAVMTIVTTCNFTFRSHPPLSRKPRQWQPIGVNDHFTKHPTREQPLSSQSCQKSRRSTLATPPRFHRPTNRRHATQQNEKIHFRQAPHQSFIKTWD